MVMKRLALALVFALVMMTQGCASDVEVNQTSSTSETTSEVIRLNNCGNPASTEQVSSRTQAITIEGGGNLGIGYAILEASVGGKYSSTKSITKSQTVTASANTNMEFILLWTEKVNTGTVTVPGKSGEATYRVSVPIQVEQASARNLRCDGGSVGDGSYAPQINLQGEIWTEAFQEPHKYGQHTISDQTFQNFSFEADVRFNDNAAEYHGLMFGLQADDDNFYSFRISPSGTYALDIWQDSPDSTFSRVLGPNGTSAILTGAGQVNHLRVDVSGGQLDFYINNQQVGSINDTTFMNGKLGFVSCTCDGSSSASATFLNALVVQNP